MNQKKLNWKYKYGIVLSLIGLLIVSGILLYESIAVGGLIAGFGVIAFYLLITGIALMSLGDSRNRG
jgi:hypothetical protein